jgi:hypothetical protein
MLALSKRTYALQDGLRWSITVANRRHGPVAERRDHLSGAKQRPRSFLLLTRCCTHFTRVLRI